MAESETVKPLEPLPGLRGGRFSPRQCPPRKPHTWKNHGPRPSVSLNTPNARVPNQPQTRDAQVNDFIVAVQRLSQDLGAQPEVPRRGLNPKVLASLAAHRVKEKKKRRATKTRRFE